MLSELGRLVPLPPGMAMLPVQTKFAPTLVLPASAYTICSDAKAA